jgi:hypothetical protein
MTSYIYVNSTHNLYIMLSARVFSFQTVEQMFKQKINTPGELQK